MRGELVLGVLGGVIGIFVALFEMTVGGIAGAIVAGRAGAEQIIAQGFATLVLSIIGIIGGAIVDRNDKWAGIMMLFSGLVGFVTASIFWLISGIL